ncbi:hypothetical protein [Planctomicrobium sp. SH664]|uniref:hypothetical protein n=1 Tax=Planctomicrobium sp. SH664 TaxID=3448125 RepID=UPI003F5B41BB
MNNHPIFTATIALLVLGGVGTVYAWQAESETPPSAAAPATQTPPAEVVIKEDPQAVAVVKQARERLYQHQSVRANMVQDVSIGDYSFHSEGTYLSASDFRYRLEYVAKLEDLEGTFLEVCDGQILHTVRKVAEARPSLQSDSKPDIELSRRDIQKILREARLHQDRPVALRAAEIGLGGLPSVLASLERTMIFDAMRPETVDGREYLVVQGRWRADQAQSLIMGLGGLGGQLAGFLPDTVRVYFAKETLFPERFRYFKRATQDAKKYHEMISVKFQNVVLDQPVAAQQFAYIAVPGYEEKDDTLMYLEMINAAAGMGSSTPSAVPRSAP